MNNPLFNKILMVLMGIIILFALGFILLYLINIYMPFLIGLVVAVLANVIMKPFKNTRIPRSLLSFIAVLLVLSVIVAVFYGLFVLIRSQIPMLTERATDLFSSAEVIARGIYDQLALRFPAFFEVSFDEFLRTRSPNLSDILTNSTAFLGGRLFGFARSLPSAAFFLIITLISAYFISIEYDRVMRFINKHVIQHKRVHAFLGRMKTSVKLGLGSWIKAQLIIMFFLAIVASIGFWIIGYDNPVYLGIALGIFDALPLFGSGAILLPLFIYNLLMGRLRFAIYHLVIYGMIAFIRQMIEPRVIGRQIGINPLITLLTLYTGFRLAGIMGMIFSLLVMVILVSIFSNKADKAPLVSPIKKRRKERP